MEGIDDVLLDRFRSQVGASFLAVSRESTKFGEVTGDSWCAFSGIPRVNGNRFLIHKCAQERLASYEAKLEELGVPSSGMLAGEGKSLKLGEKWKSSPPTPLMVYNLQEISEEELSKNHDSRVYVATNADYDRVVQCLVESFHLDPSTAHESPFAYAAKDVDTAPDYKIFLVDDGGKVASIVYAVTVQENSILLAMGTIPTSRRKGLAKAILRASFIDAKKQGLLYSVLFASELGKLLYDSVGFKTLEDWSFNVFTPSTFHP